jgi:hypothetical protein
MLLRLLFLTVNLMLLFFFSQIGSGTDPPAPAGGRAVRRVVASGPQRGPVAGLEVSVIAAQL